MSWLLLSVSIMMELIGARVFACAKRALHASEAEIFIRIAAVLLSGAASVDTMHGAAEVKTPGGDG